MSQHDWHLTTEQLSAYLDRQLSEEEQKEYKIHLDACEQCRQTLLELRQTVTLLHALPQPRLPRSFVLPVDTVVTPLPQEEHIEGQLSNPQEPQKTLEQQAQPAGRMAQGVEGETEGQPVPPLLLAEARARREQTRGRRTGRTVMRLMSGLVAVLGIFLLITALNFPNAATSMSTSAGGASVASAPAPNAQSRAATRNSAAQVADGTSAATPSIKPAATQPEQEATNDVAGTPSAFAANNPTPAPVTPTPRVIQPFQAQGNQATAPPAPPVILFFDLSQPAGRAGLGILLLIAGSMGLRLFRRRPSLTD